VALAPDETRLLLEDDAEPLPFHADDVTPELLVPTLLL
jgi:hypothetical protein